MTATAGGALALFGLVALLSSGALADVETIIVQRHAQLLGSQECTYGPSFWCKNLTNAAGCKAVKHCIQTTWISHSYPEDYDDICTICKNMVKEARDTLTSDTTLEELKEVFDGSCELLPSKVIKNECKKLANDFIPELIDTLASQMDPNVVCTVSGLCNNARIDKLLLENKERDQPKVRSEYHLCEQCAIAMEKGEHLVQSMSRDDVLNRILMMCGELSSYSDACSSIVLTYHNEIYNAVKNGFNKRSVCMLSGMCSEAFHPHADGYEKSRNALMGVEISNAGERGRIQIQKSNEVSDDLTCEFCEALVKHLRDIVVANTTEEQFSAVLKGLCKQTGRFATECLAIVDEDYTRIYQFLVGELNGKVLCTIVGICPKSLNSRQNINYIIPMYPLLPIELLQTQESTKIEEDDSLFVEEEQNEHKPTLVVVDEQPPKVQNINVIKKSPVIDVFYKEMHFVVNDVNMPTDKTTCFLCQSVLNYVQQVVTDPKSEAEIRIALEKSCLVVPSSFKQQCKQFVDQYGDAFISLVVQEVDPSIICPELKLCPATDLSLTSNKDGERSNNCPMCVIFMSALKSEISNKDTEEVMKVKLEKLCTRLPSKWKAECIDFISTRLQSILDMLVAQVQPEEICVLLDICKPKTISDNDFDTNMIASSGQVTIVFPGFNMGQLLANNYKMLEEPKVPTPLCIVCSVVMKYLHGAIKDKTNQEAIEHILESVCSILPNVEENNCQTFIDSNYKQIINFIQIGTDPALACMALMVCEENQMVLENNNNKMLVETNVKEPVCYKLCRIVFKLLRHIKNNKNQAQITKALKSICRRIPRSFKGHCEHFVNSNFHRIVKAIEFGTKSKIACLAITVEYEDDKIGGEHYMDLHKNNEQLTTTKPANLDRTESCAACEAFITVFEDSLTNGSASVDEIDLMELCNEVEVLHKDQCMEMLESYAQTFKNLYNQMPTWMMCERMTLCSENKSVAVNQLSNSRCLEGLDYWCASWDNANECKVDNTLSLIKFACKSDLVNSSSIIRAIIEVLRTTCPKRCGAKIEQVQFHPKCTICKDVIHDIKNKIENSPVEKDIKYRLESLCDILPDKSKCVDFVDQYTEKLLNTVIDDIKEQSVCAEIGYC